MHKHKPFLRISIFGVVLLALGYLTWGIRQQVQARRQTAERVAHLPAFRFQTLSGGFVTDKDRPDNPLYPLWLLFFHSDCDFCQHEAEPIRRAAQKLEPLSVWLVSAEPPDTLRSFARRYGLDSLTHVQLFHVLSHDDYRTFGVRAAPASLLYRSDGSLVRQFTGAVRPETVLKLAVSSGR